MNNGSSTIFYSRIDDYERALDVIGLESDDSDSSSVIHNNIDIADDNDMDLMLPSPVGGSGSAVTGMFFLFR